MNGTGHSEMFKENRALYATHYWIPKYSSTSLQEHVIYKITGQIENISDYLLVKYSYLGKENYYFSILPWTGNRAQRKSCNWI